MFVFGGLCSFLTVDVISSGVVCRMLIFTFSVLSANAMYHIGTHAYYNLAVDCCSKIITMM